MVSLPPDNRNPLPLSEAIALYATQIVSQGRVAELAGVSRAAFLEALGEAKVSPFQYSAEEVLEEAGFACSRSTEF